MGETSWCSRAAIDCDSDVHNIPNLAEKIIEVLVGHLERHVTDEERLGWFVTEPRLGEIDWISSFVELNCHAAALED